MQNVRNNVSSSPEASESLLSWMRAFQLGDKDAFDRIYSALWGSVRLRACKMGLSRQDSEEIAQKVLVRVYLYAPRSKFHADRQIWAWVYTITSREVYKHWRRKQPELITEEALAAWATHVPNPGTNPIEASISAELSVGLDDCIGRLDVPERLFLLGPLVGGLTFRKAAAVHGLRLGQFKHRHEKALGKVRECMKAKGHTF